MLVAEQLVQGVDLWINTPRRPWEASGTSGMKVLVNGGLNLSELDGWWAEAYAPEVGWALGDGQEHGDDPAWDAPRPRRSTRCWSARWCPEFYTRDAHGIPAGWVARMRESMARLTPRFSANRMVREYTERVLPARAPQRYRQRAADAGCRSARLVARGGRRSRSTGTGALRRGARRHRDGEHRFSVEVYLGDLDPRAVRVELYAEPADGGDPVRQTMEMVRTRTLQDSGTCYQYAASVPAARPAGDYTARLVPWHAAAAIPLEAHEITWQR